MSDDIFSGKNKIQRIIIDTKSVWCVFQRLACSHMEGKKGCLQII